MIMGFQQKHRRSIWIVSSFFTVISLFSAVLLRMYRTEILFLEDVGLDTIFSEKIKAVRYEVDMPDGRWESQDTSEIIAVLDTLRNATFRRTGKPKPPVTIQGTVYIETDQHTYGLGIISGKFSVNIDGNRHYYECSAQQVFWLELFPIIVSYEKNMPS